jgi:acyl-CoA thioester hydrolase
MRLALDPSTDPADYVFSHRIRVRFAETDAMGIVHHAAYLPYLEEARVAWLRSIGHAYDTIRAEGVDFGVLEAFVQYRLALRFDEVIDVHLRIGAVTGTTFQVAYLLTVDGSVRATAVTVHGAMGPTGRPTRLPAWVVGVAG